MQQLDAGRGLDARQGAGPDGVPGLDRIFLAGMRFEACHGVFDFEKTTPQPFEVDVALYVDLAAAGQSDDLADTVDYGAVFDRVAAIVTGPPVNLIEHLAARIADAALALDARVHAVTCRVYKPEAPLPGPFRTVMVEVTRRR